LSASAREPESGHHLVEYEQSAGFCSQIAQALKKSVFRQHAAHIADYGFQYDAGYLISDLAEDGFNRREIIKRNGKRMLDEIGGNAGAIRKPEGGDSRTRLCKQRVA